jgi:hypothetical protein
MKTLKVEIKNVYGKDLIYPACEDSEIFTQLIGQATLGSVDGHHQEIELIKKLGYEIEVITKIKL